MKTASIHEIKQELIALPPKQLLEHCLRLAKYKKENKELLTFLLFELHDEQGYIVSVKLEIDENFETISRNNLYLAKKSLRKILRAISKYSKHIASRQAEAEMLLYFCRKLQTSGIAIPASVALTKLYRQQLKKIGTLIDGLHEDLRYDYAKQLEDLS